MLRCQGDCHRRFTDARLVEAYIVHYCPRDALFTIYTAHEGQVDILTRKPL